jgi:membrane-bound ClpP family serine protease
MWIITGVLLGSVCLATVVGFHTGPHAHAVAGVAGLLVAGWLAYLALGRGAGSVLWPLFFADLVVSAGVGALAWKGLSGSGTILETFHLSSLEGAEGVVVSELAPEGIVSVRGEQWSAISVNGNAAPRTRVQVLRAAGVRLEVWGEDAEAGSTESLFSLREDSGEDGRT